MTVGPESQKMIDRLKVATDRVAERIRAEIVKQDLTEEEAAGFGQIASELEEMGTVPTDPFPVVLNVEGATWDENARTLNLSGAFESYSPQTGEVFVPAGGTGVNVGTPVPVESKRDADGIVLGTSIGADADGQSDVSGVIRSAASARALGGRRR